MTFKNFISPLSLRRWLHEDLKRCFVRHLRPDMLVYDIGCGSKPFGAFLSDKVARHVGVDIADGFYDATAIDLIGSAYDVPAGNETADAVILSQVIEHLERPRDALREASRLLKPDGLLFLSFPLMYPIHAQPRDYYRYTEYGIGHLLSEAGFEVMETDRIGGFWYCIGYFPEIYLRGFERGVLKKYHVINILIFLIQLPFYLLHRLEGLALKCVNKNVDGHRKSWTANYRILARKKIAASIGIATAEPS